MYRLLVSKLRKGGRDMFKVTVINCDTGERDVRPDIMSADELKALEDELHRRSKEFGVKFLSKNYKLDETTD